MMSFKQRSSGILCAVRSCKASKRTHPERKFFMFPSDQALFEIWLEKCALKKSNLPKRLKICEQHFNIKYLGKCKLLKNAVPEYYLSDTKVENENKLQSNNKTLNPDYKEFISSQTSKVPDCNKILKISSINNTKDSEFSKNTIICNDSSFNAAPLSSRQNLITKLKRFAKIIKYYKKQIIFFKNKMRELEMNKSDLISTAKEFGKMIFNDSTIEWPCLKCVEYIKDANKLNETITEPNDLNNLDVSVTTSVDGQVSVDKPELASLGDQFQDSLNYLDSTDATNTEFDATEEMYTEVGQKDQISSKVASLVAEYEKYQCEKCEIKRDTYKQLIIHMGRNHPELNLYECERCGKEFHRVSKYRAHSRVYKLDKPFECNICKKKFKGSCNLKQHQLTHLTDKKYSCPYCNKKFCHSKGLNEHLTIHKEKLIGCPKCSKKFLFNSRLKLHMEVAHGLEIIQNQDEIKYIELENQFTCEICGRLFHGKNNLRVHIHSSHNRKRSFPCSYCGCIKVFQSAGALRTHTKQHINSKNSKPKAKTMNNCKCGECDKKHRMKNVRLKEHICEHCGKSVSTKAYLDRHIRLIHDGMNLHKFYCSICSRVLPDQRRFDLHKLLHIDGKYFHCNSCDLQFIHERSLRRHEKMKHECKNKKMLSQ